ncbi:MAG: beta-ketoacyl-ACP synthase III [Burkholderiales bacterium]
MNNVFIAEMGSYLPNAPVGNDDMEQVLGMVGERPSRARRITLRNNGIRLRHYAIDPASGKPTHTNAQLSANAVRRGLERAGWRLSDTDVLACGTSSPDQLKPGHAAMVHGELGASRLEAVSMAGVCCAGMAALKYAYLTVKSGDAKRAIATGSELASSFMAARNFPGESPGATEAASEHPNLAFEKDFLRWMLSDGAGAALLCAEPNSKRSSLRIDWIDGMSLAGELPVCMYSGAIKTENGGLRGWREAQSPEDMLREHYFAVKQDARLLDLHIPRLAGADTIGAVLAKRGLLAADVDWFLPHYSSQYFRPILARTLEAAGAAIPEQRWFTNLESVGNAGSASIYLMLDDLLQSGRLKRGERILCFVPESARFSVYYMLLTVV